MVASASNSGSEDGGGDKPAAGLSQLDTTLLRAVAEIAAKKEHPPELQALAKAMIGVIQSQAEMAQLLSQFMQLVSDENRKKAES